MTIHLTPEQEAMIQEELRTGRFASPDEVLNEALVALREKTRSTSSLVQFFRESPLVGLELRFERSGEVGRPVDL